MKRPHIICHMLPSIDGRIVTTPWKLGPVVTKEYERTAAMFDADAWIIGRVSMEPYAGKGRVPRRKNREAIPREDFIAAKAESYAIAIDPSAKLRWTSNAIDDDHVITILTEEVSDDTLAFLRERRVSYLFAGKTKIDLKKAMEKLSAHFRIRTLLLEGGGKINGSFLAADLIDELSILIGPVADGGIGTPTLFDAKQGRAIARHLKLMSVEKVKGDIVWLRYKIKR